MSPRRVLRRAVRVGIHCARTRLHRHEGLLLHALHQDARDVPRPHGLTQCGGIGAVRLVAAHVGADIRRRQQRDRMPVLLRAPSPGNGQFGVGRIDAGR